MSSTNYAQYPVYGVPIYTNLAGFPAVAISGALGVARDTSILYEFNGSTWVPIAGPGSALSLGAFDSQAPTAQGLALVAGVLSAQSADATHPGMVNLTTQTFSGNKTFTGTISASNLSGTNTGDVTLGTANGLSIVGQALSLALSSTSTTGALSSTDWNTFNSKQSTVTIGALDAQAANANGLALVSNVLSTQSADATRPGLINNTTQTLSGSKTFSSTLNTDAGIDRSTPGTLTIGATNSSIINIGNSGSTVNIQGTTIYENTPNLLVADPLITVNTGGGAGSGQNSGIEVEENGLITGYNETSSDRNSWIMKAPNTAGVATVTPGASGITLDQSSHNPVTIGTANGLSLATQALSLGLSSTSTTGALSSTDWNTFNSKQSSGSYITALTGDGTATGPGSVALTLATVNSNVGSFGSSTSIPSFTVNAKGLVTAASGNVVIAPAGTLTGTTLNSTVVTSSLTSVGTITSGTWNGSTIALANGGTGQTTKAPAFDALSPMTTGGDLIYGGASGTGTRLANGSAGQFLKSQGTTLAPIWAAPTITLTAPTIQQFTSGSGTYTTAANALYIRVRMVGGGGGGGCSGTSSGGASGNGAASTFGTTLLNANGGTGAGNVSGASLGGAGGTASLGTGPIGKATSGAIGGSGSYNSATNALISSGFGAGTPFAGAVGGAYNNGGNAATANTGCGGAGGGGGGTALLYSGGGGGAGGYVDAIIASPSATYAYAIGAGGAGGTAGGSGYAGGAGASGYIEVTEYYQ